jgi:hypothetical protein
MTRITGTLHKDINIYFITTLSVLLRIRNILDTNCTEYQNTHFMNNEDFCPRKSCRLRDGVEKYYRARHATDMAHEHCMLYT